MSSDLVGVVADLTADVVLASADLSFSAGFADRVLPVLGEVLSFCCVVVSIDLTTGVADLVATFSLSLRAADSGLL